MPPISEEERENLVAYLDGELDEAAARAVEARMNVDPQVRAEVEALKQAWDMLEFLPRPEPSASFTHRTMERLAVLRPNSTATLPRIGTGRRWLRLLAVAVGLLVALAGSFALAVWLWPRPAVSDAVQVENLLIEDLRLIKNKKYYDQIEDLRFLKALDQPDLFGDEFASPTP